MFKGIYYLTQLYKKKIQPKISLYLMQKRKTRKKV